MTLTHLRSRLLRRTALASATAVTCTAIVAAPASALSGPVAFDDKAIDTSRTGAITLNILDNDRWDSAHTAEVVDVRLVSANRRQYPAVGDCDTALSPAVSWQPSGSVTVDFGPYAGANPAPSLVRDATLVYTLRDDAGQESSATIQVSDQRATAAPVAHDDTNATLGQGRYDWSKGGPYVVDASGWPVDIEPLFNDDLGPWGNYDIETVGQPSRGSMTVSGTTLRWTPPAQAYTAQQDTMSYRVCTHYGPRECSAPATITIETVKPHASAHPVIDVWALDYFWEGGPTRFQFDPMDEVRDPGDLSDTWAGWSVRPASGTPSLGYLAAHPDGTWSYDYADWPTTGEDIPMERLAFEVLDRDDEVQYRVHQTIAWESTPTSLSSTLLDDEAWAAVGQSIRILPFANDDLHIAGAASGGRPIGAPDDWHTRYLHAADLPALGDLDRARYGAADATAGVGYTAGSTPGTDRWTYELCAPYPVRAACDVAEVLVHVTPAAQARDDHAEAVPGAPTDVDVLANDDFTDRPDGPGAAEVTITDIPDGVDARVLADRSIEVTVPDGYERDEVNVGYRLRDWTGQSQATVRVDVASAPVDPPADVPIPDPTCETDVSLCPEPPVDPTCETDVSLCPEPPVEPTCETDQALCPEPPVDPTCETDQTLCPEPPVDPPTDDPTHWIHWICDGPPTPKHPHPTPDPGPRVIHAGATHPVPTAGPAGTTGGAAAALLGLGALLTLCTGAGSGLLRRRHSAR